MSEGHMRFQGRDLALKREGVPPSHSNRTVTMLRRWEAWLRCEAPSTKLMRLLYCEKSSVKIWMSCMFSDLVYGSQAKLRLSPLCHVIRSKINRTSEGNAQTRLARSAKLQNTISTRMSSTTPRNPDRATSYGVRSGDMTSLVPPMWIFLNPGSFPESWQVNLWMDCAGMEACPVTRSSYLGGCRTDV
ncbi:hypothetical protein OBBRIDRAFT_796795 [Obba rivulosa]|uniref:Uncharacterized protein n=1 Tax=Obba rivulosa TaxID=1052685 RepID=A0A8E2ARV9_9APHY|nr:hypothetical protein OBBRIDRAFT_796795 [Obba rivulosa]